MSARINGAVVVTNPRPLHASNGDNNKSWLLLLDAHFFLSDGSELTVLLKYFNENKTLLHDPDAGVVVVLEATVCFFVTPPSPFVDVRIPGRENVY